MRKHDYRILYEILCEITTKTDMTKLNINEFTAKNHISRSTVYRYIDIIERSISTDTVRISNEN